MATSAIDARAATLAFMHEGKRIMELLTSAGHNHTELAKAAGVSRQAIGYQLGQAKIGKNAWIKISIGLQRLSIDPALVRPLESVKDPEEDLRPMVDKWGAEYLRALRHVIEAHPNARGKLLFWIDGRVGNK